MLISLGVGLALFGVLGGSALLLKACSTYDIDLNIAPTFLEEVLGSTNEIINTPINSPIESPDVSSVGVNPMTDFDSESVYKKNGLLNEEKLFESVWQKSMSTKIDNYSQGQSEIEETNPNDSRDDNEDGDKKSIGFLGRIWRALRLFVKSAKKFGWLIWVLVCIGAYVVYKFIKAIIRKKKRGDKNGK